MLREHAVEAITTKRFHCEGGVAYATLLDDPGPIITGIVALQTIADYLDTICDRGTSDDGADYRQLHGAMLDAVEIGPRRGSYYALHPQHDDGGYLAALVEATRRSGEQLPGFAAVSAAVAERVVRFADLQEYKHLRPPSVGIAAMVRWYAGHRRPGLDWWEFAAACGSTLGMFALMRLAVRGVPSTVEIRQTIDAYVPWICSFHILLDYLIDQEEDVTVNEINLVAPYPDEVTRRERLIWLYRQARAAAKSLPDPGFHLWVVDGLPGSYLADPKANLPSQRDTTRALLSAATPFSRLVWRVNRLRARRRPSRPAPSGDLAGQTAFSPLLTGDDSQGRGVSEPS